MGISGPTSPSAVLFGCGIFYQSGYFVRTNPIDGTATSTAIANAWLLVPFAPIMTFTANQVGFRTASSGLLANVAVYGSNSANLPSALLSYTGDIDVSGPSGDKTSALPDTLFSAGSLYWIGINMSISTNITCAGGMSLPTPTSPILATRDAIVENLAYSSTPPSPWSYGAGSTAYAGDPPSFKFQMV